MNNTFKPQRHLINILKNTAPHHPNFTIFLGAGASVTSNVLPAGKLIEQWREQYQEMYEDTKKEDSLLAKQYWYEKATEYSILFEMLYDHPSQRREFIETCINDATPSWGYIYLVNLLKNGCFNTIFTTNFDDLVNEACYTFSSDLKPIVCAHDSSINSVRLTSERPKIVKLHGDFLFDNIKNTVRELESLEGNMRSKFKQFASEFGMIVVGYAGNDRSIMDTLNTLLHSGENFPHGVYWCIRKGTTFDSLSEPLKALTRFPKFNLVEIDGFDEFFAEVHNDLDCTLQAEVANPYEALVSKLNTIFRKDYDKNDEPSQEKPIPVGQKLIRDDYRLLMNELSKVSEASKTYQNITKTLGDIDDKKLDKLEKQLEDAGIDKNDIFEELESILDLLKHSNGRPLMPMPNSLLARQALEDEKYDDAMEYSLEDIKNTKSFFLAPLAVEAMVQSNNFDSFDTLIQMCSNHLTSPRDFTAILNGAVELIRVNKFNESLTLLEQLKQIKLNAKDKGYLNLNTQLAKILDGRTLTTKDTEIITDGLSDSMFLDDEWLTMGFCILCDHLNLLEETEFLLDNLDIKVLEGIIERQSLPITRLISTNLNATIIKAIEKQKMQLDAS